MGKPKPCSPLEFHQGGTALTQPRLFEDIIKGFKNFDEMVLRRNKRLRKNQIRYYMKIICQIMQNIVSEKRQRLPLCFNHCFS